MLDHISLRVTDFDRARRFYDRTLAVLGYTPQKEFPGVVGYGTPGKPRFWITQVPAPVTSIHLAFEAKDRAAVQAWHAEAIAAGATDDGAPGPRPIYHESYYGAFAIDPDGHHIEACVHDPE